MHILKMTRRRARGGWVVSLAALLWVTAACTTQVTPPTAADPAPAATAAPVEAPAADPAAAPVGAAVDAAAPAAGGVALVGDTPRGGRLGWWYVDPLTGTMRAMRYHGLFEDV